MELNIKKQVLIDCMRIINLTNQAKKLKRELQNEKENYMDSLSDLTVQKKLVSFINQRDLH